MNRDLLEKLMKIRNTIISFDEHNKKYTYKLSMFDNTSMAQDAIIDTPFRYFEAVPQKKASKRKQNDTMAFDPYRDTLFDYPLVVKNVLHSDLDALDELNYHLTVQVPYCGMNCWHCYNDKEVCKAGFWEITVPTKKWSAEDILKRFVYCRRSRQLPGHKYNILRVSGGEPFLIPELIGELLDLMGKKNARDYADYPKVLWTETNLVTWATLSNGDSIVNEAYKEAKEKKNLDLKEIFDEHKDKLIIHPCFHGLTDKNIEQCIDKLGLSFDDLINGFRCLHEFVPNERLHLYPTFIGEACDPNGVEKLFKRLWEVDKCYPMKVAIISVDYYGPIRERFEKRRTHFESYSKKSSLRRWNCLLKKHYGLYYGQILRPLAEAVSSRLQKTEPVRKDILPAYEPLLVIVKSTARKEYRQELLTILAAPPNTEIVATYDNDHVEPVVLDWLQSKYTDEELHKLNEKALIVYGDAKANENQVSYLPLRRAVVRDVDITKRLIHIRMTLEDYIVSKTQSLEESEELLLRFKHGMLDYFGSSTLLKAPGIRWVLLGEEALLKDWDNFKKECFESLGNIKGACFDALELRRGWGCLLDIIKGLDDLQDLRKRGIFLQLLPSDGQSPSVIQLKEGDMTKYELRYYIPDFTDYDKDDSLKPDRTINITTSATPLTIQGYQPKPLSKYGEMDFQVICKDTEEGVPAQLIVESENQSCNCPTVRLEFSLKKDNASDG